jgi:hypothetical protein
MLVAIAINAIKVGVFFIFYFFGAGTQVETDAGAEAAGARLGGERTAGEWIQLRGMEHGDDCGADLATLRGERQPRLPEQVARRPPCSG